MKLKEFKQASEPKGLWGFLWWFVRTKEFMKIIIGVLLLLFVISITQSFKFGKVSAGEWWFKYDPVVKGIEVKK